MWLKFLFGRGMTYIKKNFLRMHGLFASYTHFKWRSHVSFIPLKWGVTYVSLILIE